MVGTACAVGVALAAVAVVASGVTERPAPVLPRRDVLAAVGGGAAKPGGGNAEAGAPSVGAPETTTVGLPQTQTSPLGGQNPTAGTTPQGSPPATTQTTGAQTTATTDDHGGSAGTVPTSGPTPTAPPTTSPPTTGGTVTTTTAAASDPTRSFASVGGVVTVACHGAAIRLVSATASDGWTVSVSKRGPDEVEVKFRAGEQEDELRARCESGQPVQTS